LLIEVPILRKTHSDTERPSPIVIDDIPIARRDRFTPEVTTLTNLRRQRKHLSRGLYFAVGIALTALALTLGTWLFNGVRSIPVVGVPAAVIKNEESLLGHLRYEEAPESALQKIDGGLKLRSTAAKKFKVMTAAARSAGINITTISAFRSVADQERIFFDIKAERNQTPKQRAEVSAPPKYSEHHTGYAVDLGDASNAGADLKPVFENTPAFKWLQANAARYNFEMSFPRDNKQGVSYEPWHWRFVGDSDSLETFVRARKVPTVTNPPS
jgi:zinc D-Ala-D-Ala carboxypeptidase